MTCATGVGITLQIAEIEWIVENREYPVEKRYLGTPQTTTGDKFYFISDIEIPVNYRGFRVTGRLLATDERNVIEITEVKHVDKRN